MAREPTVVKETADFAAAIKAAQSANKLIVIDFYADWCGPCKGIAPYFKELCNDPEFADVEFVKVDIQACDQIAEAYQVSGIPDFRMIHNGKKLNSMTGANREQLRQKIIDSIAKMGDDESSSSKDMFGIKGACDLSTVIDKQASTCLNVEDQDDWHHACFEHGSSTSLKSDCDEQLLLRVTFHKSIKLYGIKLAGGACAPNKVRIFINQTNALDFDTAETGKSNLDLNIEKKHLTAEGPALQLPKLKFANVRDITLFFPGNHGEDDVTECSQIMFLGMPHGNQTDMKEFKRVAGKAGEAH